ncbi:hypothetical protein DFH06DRAFT_1097857 [Mycena polygramma]|nr:hypothetical protein DFH06DRAFT_1097857 [Mycena polygramma]
MILGYKPSLFQLTLVLVGAVNLFIIYGTGRRFLALKDSTTYTWINKDYPLFLPTGDLPAVEMTFQESARFGVSGTESAANWDTLITNQFGIGFQHLGPYHFRYISGAYHSLHCVYTMQLDLNKPNHLRNPSHHFTHCLMYFRQIFLCNADMTLEDGDFASRNFTTDRVGQTRNCRDWDTVADWVDQNNREWAEYNGVSF